ncbi:protein mono-ADP-ribosyltransferase PARP15-like [Xenia sp. Carnegie-2017]|uniref:protein mono-ADP-ribosyltransferase PARP15-like n=1 Tax=Xenia sp. Carnegie-2017 TaxID=2897299 RepID=UPI001F04D645|nr:protein mono-ADP-ribosyltransferase PARP15-like [Xenia sp. Carnegie-2017]
MCGDVNEMRLFHGTNPNNVRSINSNNFSRSFAGVNAVKYGNGVYFARDASYSLVYSLHQCSGSQPKMYIAKVLVGEYTLGKEGLKEPPSKNDPGNPGLLYDSVVDTPSNPTIFVIFQDNQSYPEYLITLNKQ